MKEQVKPIKIHVEGCELGTSVVVDGKLIPGLVNVKFEHPVGEMPRITLECLAMEGIEVEGEATVTRYTICPGCRDRLQVETTTIGSEYRTYAPGPALSEANNPSALEDPKSA